MIEIGESTFKANVPQFILLDFVLTIKCPNMVVVMMVSTKEKFEVEVPDMLAVRGE
jgi:hypothetical protein